MEESIDTSIPEEDIVFRLLQLWEENNLYFKRSDKHNGYYLNMICNSNRPDKGTEFTLQLYPNDLYKVKLIVSSHWSDSSNDFIVLWIKECYKNLLPKITNRDYLYED